MGNKKKGLSLVGLFALLLAACTASTTIAPTASPFPRTSTFIPTFTATANPSTPTPTASPSFTHTDTPSREPTNTTVPVLTIAPTADRPVITSANVLQLKPVSEVQIADGVTSLAWSPDSATFVIGTSNGAVVYEAGTLKQQLVIDIGNSVGQVAFSPDGQTLATDGPGRVNLWSAFDGHLTQTLHSADDDVWSASFAWSPDGQTIASSVASGWAPADPAQGIFLVIRFWDVATGREVSTIEREGVIGGGAALVYSADGTTLTTSNAIYAGVPIWDVRSGELLFKLEGWQVAYSPLGTLIATSDGQTIWLWDAETRQLLRTLKVRAKGYNSQLTFSPDGRILASAGEALWLWDTVTGKLLDKWEEDAQSRLTIAFSPNMRLLLSARNSTTTRETTITVWAIQP
jgi:WD40 repeat protein